MMVSDARVLLVAKPGPLRVALQALLLSIPQIRALEIACDAPTALDAIELDRPALVLVDGWTGGEDAGQVVQQIKSRAPGMPCLVWSDGVQQGSADADAVLTAGLAPDQVVALVVKSLLPGEHA